MSMMKEFRDFAVKGNAIDLAVGVVIGAAFGKIVSSLVSDILMPPIGKLLGGMDFSNLFIPLGDGYFATLKAAKDAGVATVNYGVFLNNVVDFLIVAFALFLVVKVANAARREVARPEPAAAPTTRACPRCRMDIPVDATKCGHCTSDL